MSKAVVSVSLEDLRNVTRSDFWIVIMLHRHEARWSSFCQLELSDTGRQK